jgi:hypothetical protein
LPSSEPARGVAAGLADALCLAATVAVGIASFMPWGKSGEASRSSYEIVVLAVRLDVLPSGTAALAHGWIALPVLTGGALFAWGVGQPALATTLGALVGALGVGFAALIYQSPLVVEAGATIAAIAGVVAIVMAAIAFAARGVVRARDVRRRDERRRHDEGLESWLAE